MEREGRRLEYKEFLEDFKSLCKAIVAFSNDIGGKIVVGIRDKDSKVFGLNDDILDNLLEDIPKAIYDAIAPYVQPEIVVKTIENKSILELTVHPGARKPYYIKSEGIPKGVYLRVGAHNRRATPEILEDLMRASHRLYWDEEMTSVGVDCIKENSIRSIYKEINGMDALIADKLVSRDSIDNQLKLTHTGLLYLHAQPNQVLPQIELLYSE